MKLLRRIRGFFGKNQLDTEMVGEMRRHLELQTERNVQAGMNPDEARYAAQRQFGEVGTTQERLSPNLPQSDAVWAMQKLRGSRPWR